MRLSLHLVSVGSKISYVGSSGPKIGENCIETDPKVPPDVAQNVLEGVVNVGVGPGHFVGLRQVRKVRQKSEILSPTLPDQKFRAAARNCPEFGLPYLQVLLRAPPEILVMLPTWYWLVLVLVLGLKVRRPNRIFFTWSKVKS